MTLLYKRLPDEISDYILGYLEPKCNDIVSLFGLPIKTPRRITDFVILYYKYTQDIISYCDLKEKYSRCLREEKLKKSQKYHDYLLAFSVKIELEEIKRIVKEKTNPMISDRVNLLLDEYTKLNLTNLNPIFTRKFNMKQDICFLKTIEIKMVEKENIFEEYINYHHPVVYTPTGTRNFPEFEY